MGCFLTKEASADPTPSFLGSRRRGRDKERPSGPFVSELQSQAAPPGIDTVDVAVPEVDAHARKKDADRPDGDRPTRRRRQRLDPRLSNPPGHVHGEQVAAGWPSWLSNVAGEAIKGWTPRRADTFEKIDKAIFRFFWLPHAFDSVSLAAKSGASSLSI